MLGARKLYRASKRHAQSLLRPLVSALDGAPNALDLQSWGLAEERGRGLTLDGLALHELLERFGSPLFVVDAAKVRRNAAAFQAVPAGRAAGCEVFYSYKTNPVAGVLRLLHEAGVGAEVISPYELWLAQKLGVAPEHTLYNGPGKSDDSIRSAIELGIAVLNCNHREEIERVARIARQCGRSARVGLRISTDDSWTAQFGTPISGGQALRAFAEAAALPELRVVGVHAHRGGMIHSEAQLLAFVEPVLGFVAEVEAELRLRLEVLNFGGSLGLPSVLPISARDRKLNQFLHRELPPPNPAGALSIERYVELLVTRVEDRYRELGRPRPRIMLEPGRAMTGNTQLLLARVLTTKDAEGLRFAVLDAGINLAESVRNEYHHLLPVNRYGEPATDVHTLVGPICSPADRLYGAVRLPRLAPGDSVAILDAGAYFVPFSTSFSYPRPAIVLVDAGRASVIRSRETFEDLTRHDQALDEPDRG